MNVKLHRYAVFTALATLFLIFAGGLVTSTGSGLAVPDWPLSYGMFFPPMVGGIFYEHGHRIVAATVGFLTVILAFWVWKKDSSPATRKIAGLALLAVMIQGALGGLTVRYYLPTAVSVTHACLAQTFFCLVISVALLTSRYWKECPPQESSVKGSTFFRLSLGMTLVVYGQLAVGAIMRHIGAGLAIPDFPLSFGKIIPPYYTQAIGVHFLHRVTGVSILILAICLFAFMRKHMREKKVFRRLTSFVLVAVSLQVLLGATAVWSRKAVFPTTLHVALGAAILGLSLLLTLSIARVYRIKPAIRSYWALVKPRVTFMVSMTTAIGYFLAAEDVVNWTAMFFTILATSLIAAGASALNQVVESEIDSKMRRTEKRPLPAHDLSQNQAIVFGVGITALGILVFIWQVNWLALGIGMLTHLTYLFVYTPLKRKTPLCTIVGAIPGALPPMIGWAAAAGEVGAGGWILFGILFFWQLPHFFAIAWLYREDYARASLPMLSVVDDSGSQTRSRMVIYTVMTVLIAFTPVFIGLAGRTYLIGASILGYFFLLSAFALAYFNSKQSARRALIMSVTYLPLLFILLAIDKV